MPKDQGLQNLLNSRDKFVKEYCTEKGWNFNSLTYEQVLEIRRQPGWRDPK